MRNCGSKGDQLVKFFMDDKIIIVGSGVFGLSSALHLAESGYRNVHVFDRGSYDTNSFSPLKGADAASTDLNKLVRASYVDKTHYQDLAVQSIHKYYQWNEELLRLSFLPQELATIQDRCIKEGDRQPIFRNTGYVRLDDYDSGEEKRNLLSFEKAGLRKLSYDINNAEDLQRAKITGWYRALDPLNQRGKVPGLTGVLDSFAGVALADKSLLWVKHLCERTGNVTFHYSQEVTGLIFDRQKIIGIKTATANHRAAKVIIAAGAWSTKFLLHVLSPRLEAVGSSYVLIQIPKDRVDLINKYRSIPMINWRMTYETNFRADGVYVFPATHDGILKIGVNDHYWRYLEETDGRVISVPKTEYTLLPKQSAIDYTKFIKEHLSDIYESGATIEKSKICFAPMGQKNELVIDDVPGYENLIVCAGGGFHSFKFLPVIGRFTEGLVSNRNYKYHETFKFDYIKPEDYRPIVEDINSPYALNTVPFIKSKSEYKL